MALIFCGCAAARNIRLRRRRPNLHAWPLTRAANLSLARAARSRDGDWSADDYDVFEGNRQIGRIVLTTGGPQGMPWFWTITARAESTQNRGYAVSREQAMREFKARWANPAKF